MNEAAVWRRVKAYMPGTVDRVENTVCPGMFDVVGTFDGVTYWVELKFSESQPVNPCVLMEYSQLVWARRRLAEKAVLFLIVGLRGSTFTYRLGLVDNGRDVAVVDRLPTLASRTEEMCSWMIVQMSK